MNKQIQTVAATMAAAVAVSVGIAAAQGGANSAMPLGPSPISAAIQDEAGEQLRAMTTAACMDALGTLTALPDAPSEIQGTREFTEEYGLGIATSFEAALDARQTTPEPQEADNAKEDRPSNCAPTHDDLGQAARAAITHEADLLSDATEFVDEYMGASEAAGDAVTSWASCMADHGHEFDTPDDLYSMLLTRGADAMNSDAESATVELDQLKSLELAVAEDHVVCGGGAYTGGELVALRQLRFEAESVFISNNTARFEELERLRARALSVADEG